MKSRHEAPQDAEGNLAARQFTAAYYRLAPDQTICTSSPAGVLGSGENLQQNSDVGQGVNCQLAPIEPDLQWDEITEGATVVAQHLYESTKIEVCNMYFAL